MIQFAVGVLVGVVWTVLALALCLTLADERQAGDDERPVSLR